MSDPLQLPERNGRATVTMVDVAREAGVSRAAVSFVLRGREVPGVSVSAATRRRVVEAAAALGYRPNAIARAMVTGHNPVIGFVSYAPEVEGIARILIAAIETAEARGYAVKVFHLQDERASELARRCVELRLAGVVLVRVRPELLEPVHEETSRFRMPLVFLGANPPPPWGAQIAFDDDQGCSLAIRHLLSLGHCRVAMLSGRPNPGSGIAHREQRFLAMMRQHGLDLPGGYIQRTEWEPGPVATVVAEWRQRPDPPTAVLCVNDHMAMTLLRACRQLGVSVPRELSVIGFGDFEMARWADPPLTTLSHPFAEMGRVAVARLLERLPTPSDVWHDEPRAELLANELVIRESTTAARPGGTP